MVPNGTFTVSRGENRATYRIKTQTGEFAPGKRVAYLLTGPDNTRDYTPFAFIDGPEVKVWRRYVGTKYAQHANLIVLALVRRDPRYTVQAMSTCLRCNRALSVPSSITAGYGPTCEGKA